MGTLQAALQSVAATLAEQLPSDVSVQEHPGRFTEDELNRVLVQRKAVRVAIEGVESMEVEGGGLRKAQVRFAALVICSDQRGEDRHAAALELTEAIAGALPYQRWGNAKNEAVLPSTIDVQNLYSGDINGKGIAFWALTWTQSIRQAEE